MKNLTVYSLASSSKGNCIYAKLGNDEILIDAGISAKRISDSLKLIGTDITNIKAIFITHEHSDHVAGLEIISKKYKIPVHFTEPCANAHLSERTVFTSSVSVIHPLLYTVKLGEITVCSFETPHDSAASVGFVITDDNSKGILALATDIGHITDEIADCLLGVENIVLEANHDENMLLCGSYPYELKRRILSPRGHLSNEAAAAFVGHLALSGTKRILLAHLSEENNLPELAYHSALNAIGEHDVAIKVASPHSPTQLV